MLGIKHLNFHILRRFIIAAIMNLNLTISR